VAVHDEHLQDKQQTIIVVVHNQHHRQVLCHKRVPLVKDCNIQQGSVVPWHEVVQQEGSARVHGL
jgi:hypothetical protein